MVYISFPRADLDAHESLVSWRAKAVKKVGEWTDLKIFLEEQPRFLKIHAIPKCWYTELPQGDNYALDVEHFRPKASALQLTRAKKKSIEKKLGYQFSQNTVDGSYPWLEFEFRNYRLTSALPNRGGAKHVYFPLASNSDRLRNNEFPWKISEYSFLLDPTDQHDASQLLVLPSGLIIPKAIREQPTNKDLENLSSIWHSDKVNYLRAMISIEMYRLNDRILVAARKERFDQTISIIDTLILAIAENSSTKLQERIITPLIHGVLPSAPFSLAARSAIAAYVFDPNVDTTIVQAVKSSFSAIFDRLNRFIADTPVNWGMH